MVPAPIPITIFFPLIFFLINLASCKLSFTKNNFTFEFFIISLAKFIKRNIYGKKMVIGMGAGTISNWMRKLPELMK